MKMMGKKVKGNENVGKCMEIVKTDTAMEQPYQAHTHDTV